MALTRRAALEDWRCAEVGLVGVAVPILVEDHEDVDIAGLDVFPGVLLGQEALVVVQLDDAVGNVLRVARGEVIGAIVVAAVAEQEVVVLLLTVCINAVCEVMSK